MYTEVAVGTSIRGESDRGLKVIHEAARNDGSGISKNNRSELDMSSRVPVDAAHSPAVSSALIAPP